MAEVTDTVGHDGKPRYQKRVFVGGRQRMITAKTKTELARLERQMRDDYARGTLAERKKRLGPFFEDWLADGKGEWADSTYLCYSQHYNKYIKEPLGGYLLTELEPWVLTAWLRDLATPDRKHRCWEILHACLATAIKHRLLIQNPVDLVDKPPKTRKKRRAWDLAQAMRFLEFAREHPYGVYFYLALNMPVRPSEIRGLRWSAIDLEAGTLKICEVRAEYAHQSYNGGPKTPESARTFELSTEAIAVLRAWKATQNETRLHLGRNWAGEDYVVTGPAGKPIDYRNLSEVFARLLTAASLPRLSLYQLRHTVISVLADEGISIKVISELAGHSNVHVTQDIYQQTRKGQHKQALAMLSGLYAQAEIGPLSTSG